MKQNRTNRIFEKRYEFSEKSINFKVGGCVTVAKMELKPLGVETDTLVNLVLRSFYSGFA